MAARLAAEGPALGWTLRFPDRHPHAGGPDHYAAYLANTDGFEVELVADDTCPQPTAASAAPQWHWLPTLNSARGVRQIQDGRG
jgi:hypothetical protein